MSIGAGKAVGALSLPTGRYGCRCVCGGSARASNGAPAQKSGPVGPIEFRCAVAVTCLRSALRKRLVESRDWARLRRCIFRGGAMRLDSDISRVFAVRARYLSRRNADEPHRRYSATTARPGIELGRTDFWRGWAVEVGRAAAGAFVKFGPRDAEIDPSGTDGAILPLGCRWRWRAGRPSSPPAKQATARPYAGPGRCRDQYQMWRICIFRFPRNGCARSEPAIGLNWYSVNLKPAGNWYKLN